MEKIINRCKFYLESDHGSCRFIEVECLVMRDYDISGVICCNGELTADWVTYLLKKKEIDSISI